MTTKTFADLVYDANKALEPLAERLVEKSMNEFVLYLPGGKFIWYPETGKPSESPATTEEPRIKGRVISESKVGKIMVNAEGVETGDFAERTRRG